VSGEDEDVIQKVFVEQLGAKYPLVRVDAGDVAKYGIKFYPSVYVLDARGNVVGVPDDRMPNDAQIEKLLESVSFAPKMPEDARYEPLRALWQKADHLKVRDYLDKNLAAPNLDAGMKEVFSAQRAELAKREQAALGRVQALGAGPDYAAAEDALERIETQWKGLPPADAAAKERARFGTDAAIKKELAAARALRKLEAQFDPSKQAQRRKLLDELDKFRKKHEGTHAAKQAEVKIASLTARG
jgi:hypothetical protein